MKIFGLRIIPEYDYQELRTGYVKYRKLIDCHRWFSGWKDLDIIWDYIFEDVNYGGIEGARKKYAEARGTDVYGEKK